MHIAVKRDELIIVEDYIQGKKITVPVLGSVGKEEALPIIEIIPKNDHYDYESKYSVTGSEHIIPARIDEKTTKLIQDYAVKAHQVLGCKTSSRVAFILDRNSKRIIVQL